MVAPSEVPEAQRQLGSRALAEPQATGTAKRASGSYRVLPLMAVRKRATFRGLRAFTLDKADTLTSEHVSTKRATALVVVVLSRLQDETRERFRLAPCKAQEPLHRAATLRLRRMLRASLRLVVERIVQAAPEDHCGTAAHGFASFHATRPILRMVSPTNLA